MKRKLGLLILVALCALTGSASEPLYPYLPFAPDFPLLAVGSSESSERCHNKEPILYFVESFMEGDSKTKFEEYDGRIKNDAEDYEAYIGRAFTRLMSLCEIPAVVFFVEKFGFAVNDRAGTIGFSPWSFCDFGKTMQKNDGVDEACEIALPVLKAALADFEKVPKNWSGSMDFSHETDAPVSFDYADTLVARAAISEMMSVLYLMKGYNTVAADMTTKAMDMEALAEAQRWTRTAAELVNAFVVAQDRRTDYTKAYFFNLRGDETYVLRDNARNLVDVSHWTVRFDLFMITPYLFVTGDKTTEKKKAKREKLIEIGTLDVTLRNLFEGKLSADDGTFPVFDRGFPLVDKTLSDPTFAGTFPGISRKKFADFLSVLADERVFQDLPDDPHEEIAHYGVLYKLPEGAENNPGNPATFAADLQSEIRLLNPTMDGYSFVGWSPVGAIPVGTTGMVDFQALFDPLPPKTRSGVMLLFH